MKLQKKILLDIESKGKKVIVKNNEMKEIIGYSFNVKNFKFELSKKDIQYAERKVKKYYKELMFVAKKLKTDTSTRQAVLQFDINSNRPNCIVSFQFFIRNDELITIVYSRSMDAKNKLIQDVLTAQVFSLRIMNEMRHIINNIKEIKFYVGNIHVYKKEKKK